MLALQALQHKLLEKMEYCGTMWSMEKLTAENLLNQDDFEKYVAVATTKEDLMSIFQADYATMDKFARETYGLDFNTAYGLLLRRALAEYKSCLSGLASVGNATAINTINQIVLNLNQQQDVRINVVCDVPKEDEHEQ